MSKKKRKVIDKTTVGSETAQPDNTRKSNKTGWLVYLKSNWWTVAIVAFLSIGVLGAGLKYLDEDAKREIAKRESRKGQLKNTEEESLLSKINPFVPAPPPVPTPQLSKEYIYAGGKLLAVEDANANAAPPSDLAIWRPSTGTWWMLNGQNSQYYALAWGASGDNPQPGDFDGDGKTDFCIFRSNTNEWWIVRSSDWSYYVVAFGQAGDVPAPADYDGDGKTDIAVFRTGTWHIFQSVNGVVVTPQFGQSGDLPAPKDFDGDGKSDLAFWRNSNKTFYSHNSSNNTFQWATFDYTTNKLVPGDYDGDGRADYAIRVGANWIIKQSSNNQTYTISWHEEAGDKEVQNDYDGDGKVDIAVWKNSNGNWYIRQSSLNGQLRQVQWGMAADVPVPAFYRW